MERPYHEGRIKFLGSRSCGSLPTLSERDNLVREWISLLFHANVSKSPSFQSIFDKWDYWLSLHRDNTRFNVVISGQGKAGKSLLGNAILDDEESFKVDVNPCTDQVQRRDRPFFTLFDTPGIDANGRPYDEPRALEALQEADLLLYVKNADEGDLDEASLVFLEKQIHRNLPAIIVLTHGEKMQQGNKIDRIINENEAAIKSRFGQEVYIPHIIVKTRDYFRGPKNFPDQAKYYREEYSGIEELRRKVISILKEQGIEARRRRIQSDVKLIHTELVSQIRKQIEDGHKKREKLNLDQTDAYKILKQCDSDLSSHRLWANTQAAAFDEIFKRWDNNTSGAWSYLWNYKWSVEKTIMNDFSEKYLTKDRVENLYNRLFNKTEKSIKDAMRQLWEITGETDPFHFRDLDKRNGLWLKYFLNARPDFGKTPFLTDINNGYSWFENKDILEASKKDKGQCWQALKSQYQRRIHTHSDNFIVLHTMALNKVRLKIDEFFRIVLSELQFENLERCVNILDSGELDD